MFNLYQSLIETLITGSTLRFDNGVPKDTLPRHMARLSNNQSPKGNMWSAIPIARLCMIVNESKRKQGSLVEQRKPYVHRSVPPGPHRPKIWPLRPDIYPLSRQEVSGK